MLNVCNRQLEQNAVTIADVTDEAIETQDKLTDDRFNERQRSDYQS